MFRGWIPASILVAVAIASGACATTRAAAPVDGPPLIVPAPPTRVVQPPEPEAIEPAAAPATDEPAKPTERRRVYRPRPETTVKPEPRKPDPPAVAEPPAPAAAVQNAPAASQGEMERRIRDTLSQAEQNLGRVRTATLDRDALEQYNTARRFLRQARAALDDRNLVYAQTLADKAATIASDLSRRDH